jgi:Na+-transporting NADH:ubiquinone oxidoreductase subunit A
LNNTILIDKGHDIRISGVPRNNYAELILPKTLCIMPSDFRGVKPKLLVNKKDKVKIGTPLFFDKNKPDVKWASPGCGTIKDIIYGPRRIIEKIEINIDGNEALINNEYSFNDIISIDGNKILENILKANLFPLIRQRPFNKIPDPNTKPRDIFISVFNTAPLAIDLDPIIENNKKTFQAGINALSRLTSGNVYVSSSKTYNFDNAINQKFSGPHPAGNIGIQIHHIKPLKPNEVVWTLNAQNVITIGNLFLSGKYNPLINICVGGSGSSKPQVFTSYTGTSILDLVKNQNLDKPVRIISGDVLTGKQIKKTDYIGFYDTSISMISDSVDRPFLGMLSLGDSKTKYSLTNTFMNFGSNLFDFNTAQKGELRPMVPLNAWEKVLPMDIYPNHLYRSILAEDIEEMEQLGIWECDDEDFALCSFACPSKIDVGQVIRKGLDLIEADS